MAVHADGLAPAAEVAVGLLRQEQEVDPLGHRLGVLAVGLGVAGAEVGQQGEAGHRGVGLPVEAFAEAGLAGGAVDGEVVLPPERAAVVAAGDTGVPSAVGVLVPRQPGQGALDGLLARRVGAGALGQGRTVGVEPRSIDLRDVAQRPSPGRPPDLGEPGEPVGCDPRQVDRPRRPGRPPGRGPGSSQGFGPHLAAEVGFGQVRARLGGGAPLDDPGRRPRGGRLGGDDGRGRGVAGAGCRRVGARHDRPSGPPRGGRRRDLRPGRALGRDDLAPRVRGRSSDAVAEVAIGRPRR